MKPAQNTDIRHDGFCKTLVEDSGLEHPRVGSVRGGRRGLLLLPWLPSPWVTVASGVIGLNSTLCNRHSFGNQCDVTMQKNEKN